MKTKITKTAIQTDKQGYVLVLLSFYLVPLEFAYIIEESIRIRWNQLFSMKVKRKQSDRDHLFGQAWS